MGYTHYVTMPKVVASQEAWDSFIDDFKQMLPSFKQHLDTDPESDQCLSIDKHCIRFNGKGDLSHETFYLEREWKDDSYKSSWLDEDRPKTHDYFTFCKTAQKPYDIAVCGALIIAKKHFGDNVIITSDGDDDNWEDARDEVQFVLGYGEDFHLPESGPKASMGGYFNGCNHCTGEGCVECEKPCAVGCHNVEDTDEYNHATGTMDWGVCTICGYGVSQMWHHEYIGEAITSADHPKDTIKEYY